MSEIQNIDVLVIGLGPAGARAAMVCAQNGLSVLGIDSKPKAGVPVQCAEFVPNLLTNETLAAFETEVQLISDMFTFVENDAPDRREKFSGRMINRDEFDAALVNRAIESGAKTKFATRGAQINDDGTVVLNDGEIIKAKIIIGADGPRSIVGAKIGKINSELLETRQYTIDLNVKMSSTDIYLSGDYIGGYAWLFPKNGKANLGIGVCQNQRHLMKPLLDALHSRLVSEGKVRNQIHYHTGGAIPVGGMLKPYGEIADTLVLLAGDAAGLTNPITGAGIPAAIISGRMAGECAVSFLKGDKTATDEYYEDLEDMFGSSLRRARAHFKNLLEIHKTQKPSAKDLRNSWIAYPQYWSNSIEQEKENDLLEA